MTLDNNLDLNSGTLTVVSGSTLTVTGNVDVTGAAVAVDIISLRIGAPQAVLKKTTALKTTIEGLMDTAGL